MITLSNLVSRRAAAGLIGALLVMGGTGCSGAASSTPPPASPAAPAPTATNTSAEFCTAVADFRTSATQLTRLDPAAVGPAGVKAALQNVSAAAGEVANAAGPEFAPQTQDLNKAISDLGSTIEGLQDQADLRAKLGAIATAAREVEQAMTPILDKARTACPSDSTRPTS